MRIRKYYAPFDTVFWGPRMREKYNFKHYSRRHDTNEPLVVFGIYGGATKSDIMNHRGLCVCVWSGSDSVRLHERPDFVDFCKFNAHRVFHIAHSHWIQTDLAHYGLKFIDKVVIPIKLEEYSFEKEVGDAVYHYGTHQRLWYYGTHLMKKLDKKWNKKRGNPRMIITTQTAYGKKELYELYKESFVGVRLTEHDNMAMSVVEMGLMGRRSIFNGNVPCAISYPCHPYDTYCPLTRKQWVWQDDSLLDVIEDMIIGLRGAEPDAYLAEEMREFCYDNEDWLDTKFYE
jgi:hypothetical protein